MDGLPGWFALQSFSSAEPLVHKQVTEAGFRGFFPHRVEVSRGKTRVIPRFPGYQFVEFDRALTGSWERINGFRGVVKLLPVHSDEPTPCPPGMIEELIDLYASGPPEDDEVDLVVRSYVRGDLVRIEEGPWFGHVGEFRRQVRGSVELMVPLLGRSFPLQVPTHQTSKEVLPGLGAHRITRKTTTRSSQYGRGPVNRPVPKAEQEVSRDIL
jgi:transcription antitermination factor NusG